MKLLIYILFLSCVFVGCQIVTQRDESLAQGSSSSEMIAQEKLKGDVRHDERYSLAEDRAKFDDLRKEVPVDTKARNDEKSLYMEWMSGYRLEPSVIRSKFSVLVSKKRDKFNKDMNKIREEYSNEERKAKEAFTKVSNEERTEIREQNVPRDKKNELFSDHDAKRKEFFSKIRENRDSFEVDYRQKRKDFEEYIKEKSDEFYAELKNYTVKFNELKKQQQK